MSRMLRGGRGTLLALPTSPAPNLPCRHRFLLHPYYLLALGDRRGNYRLLANHLPAKGLCSSTLCRRHMGDNTWLLYWCLPSLILSGGREGSTLSLLPCPLYSSLHVRPVQVPPLPSCGATVAPSSITSRVARLLSSQAVCTSISSSFKISSNRISLESIWVDLTIYGSVGCCSPPIADEGDGALEVVPPCLKLPMGRSSSKSLSTLKTFA